MTLYPYRDTNQIERYISQFMRVFSGFQVRDGVERNGQFLTKRVPVVYGNMSRVVAHILKRGETFTNQRIPLFAVNMAGLEMDLAGRRPSSYHMDTVTTMRVNPEDPKQVDRLIGPAYIMNMEVSIYASSTKELFNILEQVLLIFNPRITINVDNSSYNSDYITQITLTGIQDEIQYPMGTDAKIVVATLGFSVPIRLRYPYSEDTAKLINEIHLNILDETYKTIYLSEIITAEETEEEEEEGNE